MNASIRTLALLAVLAIGAPRLHADLLTWWKFDEAAGSPTASDSSGNANDGTLTNFDFTADSDFAPADGKFGGAIHFDGFDDFVNNSTGFQPAGDFTYAYFFKPDEADYTTGHVRDDHIYCNARPHFSFSRDNGGDGQLGMYFNIGGDTQAKSTTNSWSNADWHHVAWTFDGAEVKMYVNGVLEATVNRIGAHTVQGDGRFNVGSNAGGNATAYDGYMDDMSIWDEALSATDIAFISENGVEAFMDVRNSDSDGDGLPDVFEQLIVDADANDAINTVDDVLPGDDFDDDGASNEDEFSNRTDPVNEDTDQDGLLDGVETNSGVFNDANDTGSNPNKADTDGDRIDDGDEVSDTNGFVTNPVEADSDGDGANDATEIEAGSDPTDPDSVPAATTTILFIGGQAGPTQGADAAVMAFLEERYGAQNITYQQASTTNAGDENAFDALVISSTPGSGNMRNKFHNSTTPTLNWEEATADSGGGEYGMSSVQMTKSQTMTSMDLIEHPITFGLPPTIDFVTSGETTNTTDLFDGLTAVATAANGTGSAGPGNGQDIIGNAALFIAEAGDAVNPGAGIRGGTAPARRVMFPMTDNTFNTLTDDGRTLFGQAVDWILGITQKAEKLRITEISSDPSAGTLTISWESKGGKLYNLRSATAPELAPPVEWEIVEGQQDLPATAPENTLTVPLPADPTRLFVIEEFDAPPMAIFADDFESGSGDWSTGSSGANGTTWEFGTPSTVGPPAANSGTNCFGTNLSANYGAQADVWLRSPAIDLTGAGGATLLFHQFTDIEAGFDAGEITILDDSNDTVLEVLENSIDGVSDWEQLSLTIPASALGKIVRFEFRFTSDEIEQFPGWYIDDVTVTVP